MGVPLADQVTLAAIGIVVPDDVGPAQEPLQALVWCRKQAAESNEIDPQNCPTNFVILGHIIIGGKDEPP